MSLSQRSSMPLQSVGAEQLRSQRLLIAILVQEAIAVDARL
jgi:hypothetical protein